MRPAAPFSLNWAKGERTVGELAKPFQISRPAVSKHLRVLERAGPGAADAGRPNQPVRTGMPRR